MQTGRWGGAVTEPLADLMAVCGGLLEPKAVISLPKFYDDVGPSISRHRKLEGFQLRAITLYQCCCFGLGVVVWLEERCSCLLAH